MELDKVRPIVLKAVYDFEIFGTKGCLNKFNHIYGKFREKLKVIQIRAL